ncbi:hypothetical protein GCM10022254_46640 [Actinomadura meridiana]|uniref:Uncharacterized protein n=1 Tax=Actinomadura meridiana TaxID=559626 RepID=A0ABP8CAI8_9ACTN
MPATAACSASNCLRRDSDAPQTEHHSSTCRAVIVRCPFSIIETDDGALHPARSAKARPERPLPSRNARSFAPRSSRAA